MSKNLLTKVARLLAPVVAVLCLCPAAAFAERRGLVTIRMTDVPLVQVMHSIEQQTDYVFLNKDVDVNQKVSIDVTEKTVEDVLNVLFAGKDVDFRIESAHIVLFRKTSPAKLGGGIGQYRIGNSH